MYIVHDSIASAGSIGFGFDTVSGGIFSYILAAVVVVLCFLGLIELIRIPFDLHKRKIRKQEKAAKKQMERDRKAEEKARKKGEFPPSDFSSPAPHD